MKRWSYRLDRVELAAFFALALMLASIALVPLAISISIAPEAIERGDVHLSPPCATLARTGRPCPSCGLTRGICALGHGRIGQAQAYNRASLPLYATFWMLALGSGFVMFASAKRLRSLGPVPRNGLGF